MDAPNRKRRRSFGFWAAVVIVAGGTMYPVSFGPACWIDCRLHEEKIDEQGMAASPTLSALYYPIVFVMTRGNSVARLASRYATLGAPLGMTADIGFDGDSGGIVLFWERFNLPLGMPSPADPPVNPPAPIQDAKSESN